MTKIITLVTDSIGNIPQKKHETESLDIISLKEALEKLDNQVTIESYNKIVNCYGEHKIKGNYFFYASSQYAKYKSYIDDCLLYIQNMGGILVPNYSLAIAHENKVFQELEKKRLNIKSPNSYVLSTWEDAVVALEDIKYPFVGKVSKGFASRGVEKVENEKQAIKYIKKNTMTLDGDNFKERLVHLYRKVKYRNKYPRKTGKIIFQEMIQSLEYDWKVLVFYDRFYVLKRYTKSNDFRASGSGIFDFTAEIPKEVIEFANEVRLKLDSPLLSLDIVEKDNICYLIEYQAVHFGLVTALQNECYYSLSKDQILKMKKRNSIEYDFAYAINSQIKQKGTVLEMNEIEEEN